MFLTRIEIQGFKSFADKVVINFDHEITGIVGPNGCGKSNITDAVKWVLGEQSARSLRGTNMTDVIFSGSVNRNKLNFAEVTLVFNNTHKYLNSEFNEIEITRRIHRENGEGEYLINKVPVRLRDVQDLILDTGIGRDSLSMISQGNISQFADARPVDRRALFEEAAGVAKYKKRKTESINKLARTQDNLERIEDILGELENRVRPLKSAKKKALKYRELRDALKLIEVSVLVDDITFFNEELEKLNQELEKFQADYAVFETSVNVHEVAITESRSELRGIDNEISQLQNGILKIVNEIQLLETRKVEMDEKRKYLIDNGTNEIKAQQLQNLLKESEVEYLDRKQRHQQLTVEFEQLNTNLNTILDEQFSHNQNLNEVEVRLRKLNDRKAQLNTLLSNPFSRQHGVDAILKAKQSLTGIHDVVANLMSVEDGYEQAITVALGASMYFIVCQDEKAARTGVKFLNDNRGGRATFLPLTVLKERTIRHDDQVIIANTDGFLGLGSDFVTMDDQFSSVNQSLLGNTLIAKTLVEAQELAKRLQYRYKVITLNGEIINTGGSLTGGKERGNTSPLTMTKELDKIESDLLSNNELLQKYQNVANTHRIKRQNIENEIMNYRINIAQIEPVLDAKRARYESIRDEISLLDENLLQFTSEVVEDNQVNDLISLLNDYYAQRDEMNVKIKSRNNDKHQLSNEIDRREVQIRQIKNQYKDTLENLNKVKVDRVRLETKIENDLQRLASEYQLTYDGALAQHAHNEQQYDRSEVERLRQDLNRLGNVNMNAPEEFDEVNERYEFVNHQYLDLVESRDNLLAIIKEMDEVMVVEFKNMFDIINGELPGVFAKLFGGGTATLVLEDPDNLLETGIDIKAQPPGKMVQNIRLFSGGEKGLIAISVLFAILKSRPVPLCIFDEVDAALDSSNVELFINYLREFSEGTQFLLVTHREGTMAKVDVLYGVTMPIQGVSKLLKVQLKDATQYVEEENYNELS
ncbi:MAG: AAA family ATPase [Erysipelothrix sp.]|nr:AAA family ATPase [Erysipelothrix sp.]